MTPAPSANVKSTPMLDTVWHPMIAAGEGIPSKLLVLAGQAKP